ncbi:membrane protein insertase YidC [Merismopedia glauca]|uniref:Membrane protein insertase YidC n=1 Tax=Merismopedia glauca CCAP 1448/3 TaxID=1296344 RepID=A0A2T1C8U2_9CYAN|nr:membrane protein insertase YidC [Merismopedia glauca]PSB04702.1 membrane protein insertase YidC [Merismopedia glauca CCAP 1448/3]
MDFGVGFLSNNVMLPILDFFYQIVPSYGLAIVALTLVIRFALYPLVADSLRKMKRTKVTQPLMQKRMKEIQALYKDNPAKQQEEMSKVYKDFGNPLAGCLPLVFQMPVLFALFATLRGSPFADVNYTVNLQILPSQPTEQVQAQSFTTKPQNIYFSDGVRAPVLAIIPQGNQLVVGQKVKAEFQTETGKPVTDILKDFPNTEITPHWQVMNGKGEDKVRISADGTIEALQPGDVTLQGTIPGLAAKKGFLFINALGRVGVVDPENNIHWDILGMVLFYGISLYVSQIVSGQNSNSGNPQQDTVNKAMPLMVSGMFLFFPLPAGVLMYMVIGNIFQTVQTFILSREPLPDNLQKMVDEQEKLDKGRDSLPFEGTAAKKKEEAPKPNPKVVKADKKTKPVTNSSPKDDKPTGFTPNSSKKKTSG